MKSRVYGLKTMELNSRKLQKRVLKTIEKTMEDCMMDLKRVSGEAAPLEDGHLEVAGSIEVDHNPDKTHGRVGYQQWADQPRSYEFDYAIWIHEEHYNLGPLSEAKQNSTGGGTGLSGTKYPVGRKYLERPFDGEAETYRNMFDKNIKTTIRKG